MAASRSVVISGAGIGGLAAALALARVGVRSVLLEQAPRLEEVGAGIQLGPNATRILIRLGLADALRHRIVAPQAIRIMAARSGRELAALPLGAEAERHYQAPYWTIHRGDLQAVLAEAVSATPDIVLRLGVRVQGQAMHGHGVVVAARRGPMLLEERGIAFVAAEGLWSATRKRLGHAAQPVFQNRTAWRALVPADSVPAPFARPFVHLWLGRRAHLVHYPVRAGTLVNIVAIVHDHWDQPGWSAPGERDELLEHFPRPFWCEAARRLIGTPLTWHKWALFDLPPLPQWGAGPVTLMGDAAHPMLPFLAQGAGAAIEDAAVLADCLARQPDDVPGALRAYERARQDRTARVQRAARANSSRYHATGLAAIARNLALQAVGGARLRQRYDWLYDWRAPELPLPAASTPGAAN